MATPLTIPGGCPCGFRAASNCVYSRDVAHLCRASLAERPDLPGVEPTKARKPRR
jgi:hypothetical protein